MKERLTGALILVAVVVMLVPEMFRGRPVPNADRSTSSLDGPPLRSYTIDLRDAPGTALQVPASPVAVAAPAPAIEASPEPSHAVASKPQTAPTPAAARGTWVVQVATFARRDYAENMVKHLKVKGFNVEATGADDRGLYRVRSVPLVDRAAATALRQKMLSKGLRPIINTAQ